ncbi:MAG: O-antigen ligase family protein [Candidatus Vogelbacteria bacterium]
MKNKTITTTINYAILVGLFLLTITPLLVSTSLFFPFIAGKGFFFRVVTEIILALWIILALRDPTYKPRLIGGQAKKSWILIALGALLLVISLATAWGANPYRSFWSNFERMEGLVNFLHLGAYFLVLISVLKKEKLWFYFLNLSIAVSIVAGIMALTKGGSRIDGTFGNPTYLAVYMLVHIFLTAWLWLKHRRQNPLTYIYWPIILLQLIALYRTGTRGTLLGLVGGLVTTVALIAIFGRRHRLARKISLGILLGTVILGGVFWLNKDSVFVKSSPVLERFASISLTEQTTKSRLMIWNMSWQGFKERPILGWGPENYILVFNKYYDPGMYSQEQWFDRSHNVVFDWLISAGALGLLGYLSLFIIAFYYLWFTPRKLEGRNASGFTVLDSSLWSGLLVAYFIHNIFVFDNLISYLLFLAMLGYLHFISTEKNQNLSVISRPLVKSQLLAILAPLVIIILFVPTLYWINIKPWLANRTLIEALSWQKYPDKALESFKQVFAYQTFASTEASEHLFSSALSVGQDESVPAETRTGILTLARDQILETIKREPENARYRLFAGSFFSRIGLLAEAEKELIEARRLSPHKQAILFELGGFYINQKKYDEALALFREAYELEPAFSEARKIYALGAVYDNKLSLAADLLNAGPKDEPTFLLDERLVQAYGTINQSNALMALWKGAVSAHPEFEQPLLAFLADLKKQGIIK